jgi:NAD(P)-dependent dehydrogenase (short-subunit alcohol dehydrogenase family)
MFTRGKKGINSIHQGNMQNKTAIITGSGRGIGKETAIQMAEHVTNVVVCSRTQAKSIR